MTIRRFTLSLLALQTKHLELTISTLASSSHPLPNNTLSNHVYW